MSIMKDFESLVFLETWYFLKLPKNTAGSSLENWSVMEESFWPWTDVAVERNNLFSKVGVTYLESSPGCKQLQNYCSTGWA